MKKQPKSKALMADLSKAFESQESTPQQQEDTPLPSPSPEPQKTSKGKSKLIWLHPEDERLIKELSLYLASQEIERINPSLVLKAALRVAHQDSAFLVAYQEALGTDRRRKKHREGNS